jgi:hypothetical protein
MPYKSLNFFTGSGDIVVEIEKEKINLEFDIEKKDSFITLSFYLPLGLCVMNTKSLTKELWQISTQDTEFTINWNQKVNKIAGFTDFDLSIYEVLSIFTASIIYYDNIDYSKPDSFYSIGKINYLLWKEREILDKKSDIIIKFDNNSNEVTEICIKTKNEVLKFCSIKNKFAKEISYNSVKNNYFYVKYKNIKIKE